MSLPGRCGTDPRGSTSPPSKQSSYRESVLLSFPRPQLLHNLEQNTHNWEAFVNEGVTVVLASSAVAYDIKYQGVPMDVDVSLLTRKHLRPEDEEEHRDSKSSAGCRFQTVARRAVAYGTGLRPVLFSF